MKNARKWLTPVVLLALATPALAVNDKLSPGALPFIGSNSFQKLIMDKNMRADSTGAQTGTVMDSTWAYYVAEYDQLWLAMTIKGRNRSGMAYRYAVSIRNIACMDSAAAGNYITGYPGSDTTRNAFPPPNGYVIGRIPFGASDTMCVQTWMPDMRMIGAASQTYPARTDTFAVGQNDTTRSVPGVSSTTYGTRLLPGEFLVTFPAYAAGSTGGTGTAGGQNNAEPVYYFPLADSRGVFFRGQWVQVKVRPLLGQIPGVATTSSFSASATVRLMLSGYKIGRR